MQRIRYFILISVFSNTAKEEKQGEAVGLAVTLTACHTDARLLRRVAPRRYSVSRALSDVICSESRLVTPRECCILHRTAIRPHAAATSMAGVSLCNCGKINLQPLTPRPRSSPQFAFEPAHSFQFIKLAPLVHQLTLCLSLSRPPPPPLPSRPLTPDLANDVGGGRR